MKFVTFNIRYDCNLDGENNFCFRKPLILKKIKQEKPDIICFQEVLAHVAVWMKENLTDYYVVGCGRNKELGNEQEPVAFLKDRYNLIRMETYWLSETPDVPGSRYPEQSVCPRVCTEVVLQDLESGKVFRLINTHLDHTGSLARKLGIGQILKKLETEKFFPQAPVILAGDFNARPDSEEIQLLEQYPGVVNVTKGIGTTFHDFGRRETCIDYIFGKDGIVGSNVEKWTDVENGVYLSDHYPLCAHLEFNEQA
ncbi:MAG: endonuclease/exonuclease/phosphatase family protein [Lachnospiraceae bacterium]|nr:endonuclease/exonuclease/phosphatase family protein [Lachnospiraceae bacterium]